jgi:hypothetical protein
MADAVRAAKVAGEAADWGAAGLGAAVAERGLGARGLAEPGALERGVLVGLGMEREGWALGWAADWVVWADPGWAAEGTAQAQAAQGWAAGWEILG